MSDIRFQGFWRMDWGLGNPNKTAALIATLMVAAWVFAYIWRRGFGASLALFTVLGVCLIHTYSRGGMIAAAAGFSVLLALAPRPWPPLRLGAIATSVALMVASSIYLQADERYTQGITSEDRSISNRVELWKTAPAMMADAPGGWGLGKSGEAFMQWYQPVDRFEGYRTLVNSHLTWLVEFGWPLRVLYIFAWLTVLAICWPIKNAPGMSVALAVWATFAVAAFFSSVAESIWLWIVPGLAATICLIIRISQRRFPSPKVWGSALGAALATCLLLWLAGLPHASLRRSAGVVILGSGQPEIWILADKEVMGKNYAKTLRKYLQTEGSPHQTLAIVDTADSLPLLDGQTLIISGSHSPEALSRVAKSATSAGRVLILSPKFFPQEFPLSGTEKPKFEIAFGEFSQSQAASAWEGSQQARKLPGVGDFLPAWPELIFPNP